MDSQKDAQPPKQQPMIYICGGNCNLKKTQLVCQFTIIIVCIANDAAQPDVAQVVFVCLFLRNLLGYCYCFLHYIQTHFIAVSFSGFF